MYSNPGSFHPTNQEIARPPNEIINVPQTREPSKSRIIGMSTLSLNPYKIGMNAIKVIEEKVGRKVEKKRNMPRVLDIDILAIGSLQIHSGLLEIPHAGILERKFVLKPWNDIAPKFKVPGQNALVSEILENTDDNSDVRMVLIIDKEGMS